MTTPTAAAYPASTTRNTADDRSYDSSRSEYDLIPPRRATQRFLDRFALIALGLYHLPLFVNNYPSLGGGGFNDTGLAPKWGHVFTIPGMWVARHLFHITGPMPTGNNGDNGDVAEEFARLLLAIVIGAVVAAIWTLRDRDEPRSGWVREAIRVLLRYSIALGLTSYAIAKLFPQQFPPLTSLGLDQRVGDLRPMSLLWTFMQYSRPYALFGGVMEMVVVLLLCFRRTATLGAIICMAVMANVMLMNVAYDVPVKLYATMTVISAAVLALYDAPRLIAFFLTNRTAPPAEPSFIHRRVAPVPRWIVKGLVVGSVIVSSFIAMAPSANRRPTSSATAGSWAVTSYTRPGVSPDSVNDATRWRRFIIDEHSFIIRFANDSLVACQYQAVTVRMMVTCRGHEGFLHWLRDGDQLFVDGPFDGGEVRISSKLTKPEDYRLLRSKMRLITDR
ncbi:MAG TPA: hypothetical protein VGM82_24915 [Gemmatimonadaceae bacterium]|jgi:hypothetical protein